MNRKLDRCCHQTIHSTYLDMILKRLFLGFFVLPVSQAVKYTAHSSSINGNNHRSKFYFNLISIIVCALFSIVHQNYFI